MHIRKVLFVLLTPLSLWGQSEVPTQTSPDSTHWGKWNLQVPAQIQALQEAQKAKNIKSTGTPGWRVRVFRANSRNARQKSLELVENLKQLFPDVSVYWTYESPFFKVSLGDFRSKEEAIGFLQKNKELLPNAFVVSEAIFPAIKPEIPLPESTPATPSMP